MTFTVAIVGRPNVGKSTLFNRLTGKKHALVDDMPGVTRDRREGAAHIGDLGFTVIDTAGLEDAAPETLAGRMRAQTEAAIAHADVVLMVIDGRAGVTPTDRVFAGQLRRHKGPVVLLVNKCEGRAPQSTLAEAYSLGLGDPIPLSAEHGEGLGDLYAALAPHAKEIVEPDIEEEIDDTDDENLLLEGLEEEEPEPEALQIVIVGRPNAGKSTLVNALIGEERVLTGPEAGITRDAIAIEWEWRGRKVRLIDTAGIRKRANVTGKVEKLAVSDALRAVQYAHVVILLVDAEAPLEKQDATIAAHVIEEGRALVVAVNKWDLVTDGKAVMQEIQHRLENVL
ncbi:MAG: ribosome biogenesis GTPase Der, partial [Alphaproteobacteria bacterium]|nr:ribosome biogenesis GTPase Der [Alphaproteobacteria bacterium]